MSSRQANPGHPINQLLVYLSTFCQGGLCCGSNGLKTQPSKNILDTDMTDNTELKMERTTPLLSISLESLHEEKIRWMDSQSSPLIVTPVIHSDTVRRFMGSMLTANRKI